MNLKYILLKNNLNRVFRVWKSKKDTKILFFTDVAGQCPNRCRMPMRERIADETRPAYFAARDDGLVVFGAELNLKPGEVITKINGVIPKSTEEFYDALQSKTTGAFCKLEVLDTKGELHLAQTARWAS